MFMHLSIWKDTCSKSIKNSHTLKLILLARKKKNQPAELRIHLKGHKPTGASGLQLKVGEVLMSGNHFCLWKEQHDSLSVHLFTAINNTQLIVAVVLLMLLMSYLTLSNNYLWQKQQSKWWDLQLS